jgi:hypothetical protein
VAHHLDTPRSNGNGVDLVLYVDSKKNGPSRQAMEILNSWRAEQDLGDVSVVELRGKSIGEPLPCVFANMGVLRGLEQIQHFVEVERRLVRVATSR